MPSFRFPLCIHQILFKFHLQYTNSMSAVMDTLQPPLDPECYPNQHGEFQLREDATWQDRCCWDGNPFPGCDRCCWCCRQRTKLVTLIRSTCAIFNIFVAVGSCGCVVSSPCFLSMLFQCSINFWPLVVQGSTGAMLSGGLGRLQGLHGLTSDCVQKVRLALWNGTIIEASQKSTRISFMESEGLDRITALLLILHTVRLNDPDGSLKKVYWPWSKETYPTTSGGIYYNADMVFNKSAVEGIMNVINNISTPVLDPKASFITFISVDTTTSKGSLSVNSSPVRH